MKLILSFTLIALIFLPCAAQPAVDIRITELFRKADFDSQASFDTLLVQLSPIREEAIPVLFECWSPDSNARQYLFARGLILALGDDNLYEFLCQTSSLNKNHRAIQLGSSLLFPMAFSPKYYGTPRPCVLEIALECMTDTSIKFPNPDMNSLALLSLAGFQAHTLDLISPLGLVGPPSTPAEMQRFREMLSGWYTKNKQRLVWNSDERQFQLSQ